MKKTNLVRILVNRNTFIFADSVFFAAARLINIVKLIPMDELKDQGGAYFPEDNEWYNNCMIATAFIVQYRRSYHLCGKTGTLSVRNVARLVVGGTTWPPNW